MKHPFRVLMCTRISDVSRRCYLSFDIMKCWYLFLIYANEAVEFRGMFRGQSASLRLQPSTGCLVFESTWNVEFITAITSDNRKPQLRRNDFIAIMLLNYTTRPPHVTRVERAHNNVSPTNERSKCEERTFSRIMFIYSGNKNGVHLSRAFPTNRQRKYKRRA